MPRPLSTFLTLFASLPVRIGLLLLAFLLLCVIHGRIEGADDLLGNAKPEAKLPAAAQSALDKATDDIAKIDAKARDDANKVRTALAQRLAKAQDDATRKGDLETAMLIKGKVDELERIINEGKPATPTAQVRFLGHYTFNFPNGHKGTVDVGKADANADGYHGDITKSDGGWTITWSNRTQWQITIEDGVLQANSSDGRCALIGK